MSAPNMKPSREKIGEGGYALPKEKISASHRKHARFAKEQGFAQESVYH